MDINYILFVLTLFGMGMSAFGRGVAPDIRIVSGVVAVVAGAIFLGVPRWGGYAAFVLWLGAVLVPGIQFKRLLEAWMVGDLDAVARLGGVVGRFHPGWLTRQRARLFSRLATAAITPGAVGELLALSPSPTGEWEVERGAIVGDWQRVRAAAEALLVRNGLDSVRSLLYLRALGEVGAIDELDRAFVAFHRGLRDPARSMARLYLSTFHGETALVEALIAGPLVAMPADEARFWIATAAGVAGDVRASEGLFRALATSPQPAVARGAAQRLAVPLGPGRPLDYDLRLHVGGVLLDEARYGDGDRSPGFLVRGLIGVCCAVFVYTELSGGSTRSATLYEFGAFLPSAVIFDGEWWRFITALFLHAGIAHLAFNMVALYSLAPFVERRLGSFPCLAIYFLAGIGGLGVITGLTFFLGLDEHLVLGASGGVMGLIGATAAILSRASRVEGSPIARERLRSVGAIIGIQVVFDLLVPQTSATAHLVGALTGYLITALFLRFNPPARAVI